MRKSIVFGAASIALVTGAFASGMGGHTSRHHATKKKIDPAIQNAMDMQSFMDSGGPSGCYDPNQVTGYNRTVMERIGGRPCASAVMPVKAASTAGVSTWAGHYAGPFDGGDGDVTISGPNKSGFPYTVKMSVAGGGCSGEVNDGGTLKGGLLTVSIPTGNDADGWKECRISFTKSGAVLHVKETGDCTELHGMSCGFVGSASRVR